MAFTLQDLQGSREFRSLTLDDRIKALDAYFNQATDFLDGPDAREPMSEADMDRVRRAKNEVITKEIYQDVAPVALNRARILTKSSDQEVIRAKAQDLMRMAIYEPADGPDLTAPRNVKGADKVLQDRFLKEPGFREEFLKDDTGARRSLLKRLFFTNEESIGDIKDTLAAANKRALNYQDVDQSMEIAEGTKLHIRNNPDPRRGNELLFSVDDKRLRDAGKYPIRFGISMAEMQNKSIGEILQSRSQDLKDADERSVFGDLQRSVRSGFLDAAGMTIEGFGDLASSAILSFTDLPSDLDFARLGDDDSVPNLARYLKRTAEGIRANQSLDTKVARNIETDNLFTSVRLMDLFGQGVGQLGTVLAAGGIGGLIGRGGAASAAFASNFGQISADTTTRALQLGAKPDDARIAGYISALWGAPVETLADVTAMKLLAGKGMMAMADGGLLAKFINSPRVQSIVGASAGVVSKAVTQGAVEGGTEVLQQLIANGTLQQIIHEDLDITEGLMESLVAGAMVGIFAGGLGGTISKFKDRKLPDTTPQMDKATQNMVAEGRMKEATEILEDAKKPDAEARFDAREPNAAELRLEDEFDKAFATELANAGYVDGDQLTGDDVDYEAVIEEALEPATDEEVLPEDAQAQVAQAVLESQKADVEEVRDAVADDLVEPAQDEPAELVEPAAVEQPALEPEADGLEPDPFQNRETGQGAADVFPADVAPAPRATELAQPRLEAAAMVDEVAESTPEANDAQLEVIDRALARVEQSPPQTAAEFEEIAVELLRPIPGQAEKAPSRPASLALEAEVVPDELPQESVFDAPLDDAELAQVFGRPATTAVPAPKRSEIAQRMDESGSIEEFNDLYYDLTEEEMAEKKAQDLERFKSFQGAVRAFIRDNTDGSEEDIGITGFFESLPDDLRNEFRSLGELSLEGKGDGAGPVLSRDAANIIAGIMVSNEEFLRLAPALKNTAGYKKVLSKVKRDGVINPEVRAAEVMFSRLIRTGIDKEMTKESLGKWFAMSQPLLDAIKKLYDKVVGSFRGLTRPDAQKLVKVRNDIINGLFKGRPNRSSELIRGASRNETYQRALSEPQPVITDVAGHPTAFLSATIEPGGTLFGRTIGSDGTMSLTSFQAVVRKSGLSAIEKAYIDMVTPTVTPDNRVNPKVIQSLAGNLMQQEVKFARDVPAKGAETDAFVSILNQVNNLNHLLEDVDLPDGVARPSIEFSQDQHSLRVGLTDGSGQLQVDIAIIGRNQSVLPGEELQTFFRENLAYVDLRTPTGSSLFNGFQNLVSELQTSSYDELKKGRTLIASERFSAVNPRPPREMEGLADVAYYFTPLTSMRPFSNNAMTVHRIAGLTEGVLGFSRQYDVQTDAISGPFLIEIQSDGEVIPGVRDQDNRQNMLTSGYAHAILNEAFRDAAARGKTHVTITDAETALLTERHADQAPGGPGTEHHNRFLRRKRGMDLAYGAKQGWLHAIAREISGDQGTPVSVGVHQNANGGNNLLGKTDISGVAYRVPENFVPQPLFGGEMQSQPAPEILPKEAPAPSLQPDLFQNRQTGQGAPDVFPAGVESAPSPSAPTQPVTRGLRGGLQDFPPVATVPQNLKSGVSAFGTRQFARPEIVEALGEDTTSIDMIAAGYRTRTTRSANEIARMESEKGAPLAVGDVIDQVGTDSKGDRRSVRTRITAIHDQGSPEFRSTWHKEGWTDAGISYLNRLNPGAKAIEFSIVAPNPPLRPNRATTVEGVVTDPLQHRLVLIKSGLMHEAELLSGNYQLALAQSVMGDGEPAVAPPRVQAAQRQLALNTPRLMQRRTEVEEAIESTRPDFLLDPEKVATRAADPRLLDEKTDEPVRDPGGRAEGVVLGRGKFPTDNAIRRNFGRQFNKLRAEFAREVARLRAGGEIERSDTLQRRLAELEDKFPAMLSKRQKLAWNARLFHNQLPRVIRSDRMGRPLVRIEKFIERRVEALNHEEAIAMEPDQFSRFLDETVLLKPSDFKVELNDDGRTYSITASGMLIDDAFPSTIFPTQRSRARNRARADQHRQLAEDAQRRAEAIFAESSGSSLEGPLTEDHADAIRRSDDRVAALLDTAEYHRREADNIDRLLSDQGVMGAVEFETSSSLIAPLEKEKTGERSRGQESLNQQLRRAALKWYWDQRKKAKIPVMHPVESFPAGPMEQLMSAGFDMLTRVINFFEREAAGEETIRPTRADPAASKEEEATRRVRREEEAIDFDAPDTAGQRIAKWQARVQRLAAEEVKAYDTTAGDLLTTDPDDLTGAPVIAPELVEFAMYTRLKTRNDGAPINLTQQDARQAVADVLTILDPWMGSLYRQAFGDPQTFQESIKRGSLPEGFETSPAEAKLVGQADQEWGRPHDMPLETEDALSGLDIVHRGIMGDFWVATARRRRQLATDAELRPDQLNDDFDVSAEEANLRAEYKNIWSVRRQAFERAKARGLRPIDVEVSEDFRSDDFEFFRNYVLEARIAREGVREYENTEHMEDITDQVGEDMLMSGRFGDVDVMAMNDNLGFSSMAHAFADVEARARSTRSRDAGSMSRNRANMTAAAVGQDWLEFLERVRGGKTTGIELARRVYRVTESEPVRRIVAGIIDTTPGSLKNVRVRLAKPDDINGQLGEFRGSASTGPQIYVSSTPLTSPSSFSHAMTEELIHAAVHAQGDVGVGAMRELHGKLMKKPSAAARKLLSGLIKADPSGAIKVDLNALHQRYVDGAIGWDEYQAAYALSSPEEALAHSVITPAFQQFLLKEGLWDAAKAAIRTVFGPSVESAAIDFANESYRAARKPRERQAQRAQDDGQPHHTPAESKRPKPDKETFLKAYTSEDPRAFLRANKDKVIRERGDYSPAEAKVAKERLHAAVEILANAPDPAPWKWVREADGRRVKEESQQARRLRMAISSLFNPNLDNGQAFRLAAEIAGSIWSTSNRKGIPDERGIRASKQNGMNNTLYGTRAFAAKMTGIPEGMEAAMGARSILNRGMPGLGGGGRNRANSLHTDSWERVQKAGKGLKAREMLKAVMANQMASIEAGLDKEEQIKALRTNLQSWNRSIASKKFRGPTRKVQEMAVLEEEILKEVESIAMASSEAEALKRLDQALGGSNSKMNVFRKALIDEFKGIQPEYRFITETVRGQKWNPINNYIPYIVDNPDVSVYNRPVGKAQDITDDALASSDGEIGLMDRVGTGIQSASLLRVGLPGNTNHYYRTPTLSTIMSALSAQQYEVSTLAERMMIKSIIRPNYSPDNESTKGYFPPLVNDTRLTNGEPTVSGHVANANNAIASIAEKYHRADRSSMPSGDMVRTVRSLMKLAYYKALVGFDQVVVQTLPAVLSWATASGRHAPMNMSHFFRNLSRSAPFIGSQHEMIETFVRRHASAYATRVADANVDALTREQQRLFPRLRNKEAPGGFVSKAALRAWMHGLGKVEGYITWFANNTIGGAEGLVLRPIFITEYQRRAIENGTAKDWNDDSIFQDNVDFDAVDHAMRIVDEFGAPSDPADRGSAFISQGGSAGSEIQKFALLSFAGHQMTMASNVREAHFAIRDGDYSTAYRLLTNVVMQAVTYSVLVLGFIGPAIKDIIKEGTLSVFGEIGEEEKDKLEAKRQKLLEKSMGARGAEGLYRSIDDLFPLIPGVGPALSTPLGSAIVGGMLDLYKNELVEDGKIGPSWEDVNMAFDGKVSTTGGKMSIFGPGGELAYEMWENNYLSMSVGLLQNADFVIPERTAREMALKAFKEWQDRIRDN